MISGNISVSSMRNWNYNMCIIGYLRAIETLQGIGESDSGARDRASISHTDIYLSIEAKIPQCIVIGIPRNLIMRGIHACMESRYRHMHLDGAQRRECIVIRSAVFVCVCICICVCVCMIWIEKICFPIPVLWDYISRAADVCFLLLTIAHDGSSIVAYPTPSFDG